MQMMFEFTTPSQIIFGQGAVKQAPAIVNNWGCKAFVLVGNTPQRAAFLLKQLKLTNIPFSIYEVHGEPTTALVSNAAKLARATGSDFVISYGGGSVMDTGKAVAALLTNSGNLFDYLEVIGHGKEISHPAAPHLAIPTTAGTGTEVTRNSVILSPDHHVKVSMRSRSMLPTAAIVDPELTLSMPPHLTAFTGLDALTQLIEAFVSNASNPITDALCREGIQRAARSLFQAFQKGADREARENMALASLLGGLVLANAKLGAVHGLAAPLGGMFSAPHGAVCGCLLPHVMQINIQALLSRSQNSLALSRYRQLAEILTRGSSTEPIDGVKFLKDLCGRLQIPRLTEFGVYSESFPMLIEKAQAASSTRGNPIELTTNEFISILKFAST
jgi:alcohol dehydrogenase class IV